MALSRRAFLSAAAACVAAIASAGLGRSTDGITVLPDGGRVVEFALVVNRFECLYVRNCRYRLVVLRGGEVLVGEGGVVDTLLVESGKVRLEVVSRACIDDGFWHHSVAEGAKIGTVSRFVGVRES